MTSKRSKNRIRKLEYKIECIENYITRGRVSTPLIVRRVLTAPPPLTEKRKNSLRKEVGQLKKTIKNHKLKIFRQIFKIPTKGKIKEALKYAEKHHTI